MIGRSETDASGLAPIGAAMITPRLKDIILKVSNKTISTILDWPYADTTKTILSRSDHYSFHLKKIPAVFFFDGFYPDYHTSSDDPEKVDYEFLQKNCQFVYEVILELANGDINLRD
jgi:Zn-dependent M28 family amino/carboxypeptidase